ncbi:MAG: hypothetical protein A3F40_05155 [Chlamydiae bacterium RIFCSPHIGHO2_12_FULL_27_8]|nr:MAG: hypothetical protein A3F40_05155 [Chlamydiae bacterium RIFCSPHIGHO2_12_FULL_27_8]
MSIFEKLIINFKIKKFNFLEFFKIFPFYLKNINFLIFDSFFYFVYLFNNPYGISKKFLKNRDDSDIYQYGETSISAIKKIVLKCNILKENTFLELGSGRGRISFFLNYYTGCRITAIEWIYKFYKISVFLKKIFNLKNIEFLNIDMFDYDFKNFDYIFIYGTCLKDFEILNLIEKFKRNKVTSKIITVSYPLKDYDENFKIIEKFEIDLNFGKTDCFINQLRRKNETLP